MIEIKWVIVVGVGLFGLIVVKEFLDIGLDLIILEKEVFLGGVWYKYCWKILIFIFFKWMIEYGCYLVLKEYVDFMKLEEMMEYFSLFMKYYGLEDKVYFGV